MRKDKVIVALDVENLKKARELISELAGLIRIFKVGSELFTAFGPVVIDLIHRKKAKVFLDLKFHDIPNTVAAAVREAARAGVFLCNVHALGGSRMMREAARAARSGKGRTRVLAVTVLTSMKDRDLGEIGVRARAGPEALRLARLAKDSGLDGVVCSGDEARAVRKMAGRKFLIVTPGVRPAWAVSDDQARIVTPRAAFAAGADHIVVGRPVTGAADPSAAVRRIFAEIKK